MPKYFKKYEIITEYQITPNRMTKEVYDSSYTILHKYQDKTYKKNPYMTKSTKSFMI